MGCLCSKETYDPVSNFENVVVAQMAKEAADKLANNPLLQADKLEFQNVDISDGSADYDRAALDALLRSDSEEESEKAQQPATEEQKSNKEEIPKQ